MSKKLYLIDTTLRDGEQAPGVVFDIQDKMAIASWLDQTGIPLVEAGTPALGKEEIEDMRTLSGAGFSFDCFAWCRAKEEDMRAASRTGVKGVHISFPVSAIHLGAMKKDTAWVLDQLDGLARFASDRFEWFSVGAQDASRADLAFLKEFITCASGLGARRVRIADTVGLLDPLKTAGLFHELGSMKGITELEFHGHNDLGMATANTLAALLSGASCASVTVNGLGERAGNAALEEVVMAMNLATSRPFPYATGHLDKLSRRVARLSGQPLHAQKPITGKQVYSHETGIHARGVLSDPRTYQLFEPGLIGRKDSALVFGKHSGSAAVVHFAKEHGIVLPEEKVPVVLEEIKQRSMLLKRALGHHEVIEILHDSQMVDLTERLQSLLNWCRSHLLHPFLQKFGSLLHIA